MSCLNLGRRKWAKINKGSAYTPVTQFPAL